MKYQLPYVMGIASRDKRRIALEASEQGEKPSSIARVLGTTERTVWRWLSDYKQTGKDAPSTRGHPAPALSAQQLAHMEQLLKEQPDLTVAQIKERQGLSCHLSTVHRYILNKLGWRYKKNTARERTKEPPDSSPT